MDGVPTSVAEWIELLIGAGVLLGSARIWLVQPLLKQMGEHTSEHNLLVQNLMPLDDEKCLPAAERKLVLRALVVNTRASQLRSEHQHSRHRDWSTRVIEQLNAERAVEGKPALPREVEV